MVWLGDCAKVIYQINFCILISAFLLSPDHWKPTLVLPVVTKVTEVDQIFLLPNFQTHKTL